MSDESTDSDDDSDEESRTKQNILGGADVVEKVRDVVAEDDESDDEDEEDEDSDG